MSTARQKRRDLRLGDGRQQRARCASPSSRHALRQPRLLVAVADQHEARAARRAAAPRRRAARPARWAGPSSRHSPPPCGRPRAAAARACGHVVAQRLRRRPATRPSVMPLGTMCSLRRSSPCEAMCSCTLGSIRPPRRRRGRRRPRPPGTARMNGCRGDMPDSSIGLQRPQVVHLVDQLARRRGGRGGAPPRCPSGRCWRRSPRRA